MEEINKQWIDEATYYQLLKRWRFADLGDTIFQEDTGKYYSKVMGEKKAKLSHRQQVQTSKSIGW